MDSSSIASIRIRVAVAVALAAALTPLFGQLTANAAATGLLPDLRMAEPYDLQVTKTSGGFYKLRFGTIMWNVGDGPLEVRANGRSGNAMTEVVQIVHRTDGTTRRKASTGSVFYSGDGHDHWHVGSVVVVRLGPVPGSAPTDPPVDRHLRKIGFCLVDSLRAPPGELRPPNSPARYKYGYLGCGNRDSTKIKFGISVGYGDVYQPFFAHQAIDITNVPTGTYRLCATVNPEMIWREKAANATNNSYWFDIALNPVARTVSVIAGGLSACDTLPPPPPV